MIFSGNWGLLEVNTLQKGTNRGHGDVEKTSTDQSACAIGHAFRGIP